MKIKKTSQITATTANVVNVESDSTQNTYSCDYINNLLDIDNGSITSTSTSNYSVGGQVYKIAGIVIVRFVVQTNSASNTAVTVGSLPNGFAPSETRSLDFNQASTSTPLRVYFKSNGDIDCRWGNNTTQSFMSLTYIL